MSADYDGEREAGRWAEDVGGEREDGAGEEG